MSAAQLSRFTRVSREILKYIFKSTMVPRKTDDIWEQRFERSLLIQKYAKRALNIMGIEVEVDDRLQLLLKDNALVVCNHLSYLDILVLSSVYPSLFVTSIEMKNTPGLGLLADLGGCLYVERRSRENLAKEIGEITQALLQGLSVCIFPEATSSNGEEMKRFKRPLFNAARYAHKNILPVCLNYSEINQEKFSLANRDLVCWYGEMEFLPHMWKLCGVKKLKVNLNYLEPIVSAQDYDVSSLADLTRDKVRERFVPCVL